MLREAVAWILRAKFDHLRIARRLGEDGGGGDAGFQRVAADDACDPAGEGRGVLAVDQRDAWARMPRPSKARRMARKLAWRMLNSSISSTLAQPTAHAIAYSRISRARASRRFSESCFESLRPCYRPVRVEDHGGGADGAGERPPPGFIDTADNLNPGWLEQVHGRG